MTANIPPQPDFVAVSRAFHIAGEELAKCPDLVTFHESTEMIGLLRGLTASVAVLTTNVANLRTDVADLRADVADLRADVASLRASMADMESEMKTSHHNGFAREQNRMLHDIDGPLAMFHTSRNEPIPDFPTTPRQIQRLRTRVLGELLLALEVDSHGSQEEKMNHFRLAIGLQTDVV
ncbi:hypothetical protein MMC17_006753 [Xylographa soralifera]|nr:hypothetical protein [Xylographa soralifera]